MDPEHLVSRAPTTAMPWSPQGAVVLLCAVVSAWALLYAPALGHSAPAPEELVAQWAADPSQVDLLRVSYLRTAWDDTEGTWQTLDGLAEISAHAEASGQAGDAARAGLANLNRAISMLDQVDPLLTKTVVDRIGQQTPAPVLAEFVPQAWAVIQGR